MAKGEAIPVRAVVTTVTVTMVGEKPLTVAGLGETLHVVFGMAVTGAQVSATEPVSACGAMVN